MALPLPLSSSPTLPVRITLTAVSATTPPSHHSPQVLPSSSLCVLSIYFSHVSVGNKTAASSTPLSFIVSWKQASLRQFHATSCTASPSLSFYTKCCLHLHLILRVATRKEEDLYETLGVPRTASADEIKRQYYKLAMQYHPDRNKGDKKAEEKLQKINAAYTVRPADTRSLILSSSFSSCANHHNRFLTFFDVQQVLKDEDKRRQYDQFGSAAFDGSGGGGFEGFDPNDIPVDMRDIFEGIFSGFGGGGGRVRFFFFFCAVLVCETFIVNTHHLVVPPTTEG